MASSSSSLESRPLNSEPQQTHQTVTNALRRLPSPQLSDLVRSHVVTTNKSKNKKKEIVC